MSQSELARRAGITQGTIGGLLSGKSRSSSHLHVIARELGTTPAYLSGEVDDPKSEVALPSLSYEQRQLLACFEALNDNDRQLLLAMVMRMADRDHNDRLHARLQEYGTERSANR